MALPVLRTCRGIATTVLALAIVSGGARAQSASQEGIVLTPDATSLEGTPQVRVEETSDAATRRLLNAADAAANRLLIQKKDGKYYWASRDNSQLTLTKSGEFAYLSSAVPGRYIRIRRVNDRLSYVEHVDTAQGSVTYSGELRIILGK